MLVSILEKNQLAKWANFKIRWMKEIKEAADSIHINDIAVSNISFEKAIAHVGEESFYEFLISFKDEIVGAIEFHDEISYIDNEKITSIDMLYIEEEYRNEWYDISTIEEVKSLIGNNVEIVSWYDSEKYKSLEKMSAKKMYAKYRI